MASNIGEIVKLTEGIIEDPMFGLSTVEFVEAALKDFESKIPNKSTTDVTVSSSGARVFSLPAGVDLGYGKNAIIAIENPIVTSANPVPNFIYLSEEWSDHPVNTYGFFLYQVTTTVDIRFMSELTTNFRMTYRKPYTVDATSSDFPTPYDHILAKLAASKLAQAISNKYFGTRNISRPEDLVRFNTAGHDFLKSANNLRIAYEQFMSINEFRLNPETVEVQKNLHPRLIR